MQRNVVLLAPKTKPQMNFFAQFIPQYLLTKRSLTIMVTSTAAFAFFFVMIYKPFNVEHWAEVSRFVFAACVLGIVLLGMSIAAISRVVVYDNRLYNLCTHFEFKCQRQCFSKVNYNMKRLLFYNTVKKPYKCTKRAYYYYDNSYKLQCTCRKFRKIIQ